MKINFSEVVLKDLDGHVLPDAFPNKILANAIYRNTKDLDFLNVAIEMNKGGAVDVSPVQIDEIKRIIELPESGFFAFVKKAFLDFIKNAK